MGNQLWNEDDELLQGSHPGCMAGILHALVDYHQWHSNVKKMLPYRKQDLLGHGKFNRSPRITWTDNDSFEVKKLLNAEVNQPHVDQKTKKASSTNKRSLRARIRALVSEQGHGRKCRVPRLERTLSINHLEPSVDWGHPIIFLHKNADIGTSKLMNFNQLAENHTGQEENPGKLKESSVREELMQDKNLRQNASDLKDYENLDILEIFKVNKDLFQDVLQNTNSQKCLNTKARLTKSGSFPSAYSSTGKSFRPAKLEHKQTEVFIFPRKEKLVPDVRAPKLVSSKPLVTDGSPYELDKGSFVHIKRISSLRESTDRYSLLFETSSGRLLKLHMSKSLRLTNENEIPSSSNASFLFRRFLSFPHLENPGSTHSQESQDEKEPENLCVIKKKYIGIDYEEGPDYVNSVIEMDEISPRAEYSASSTVKSDCQKEKVEETSVELLQTVVSIPESSFQEDVKINAEFHHSEGPDFRRESLNKNEYEVSSLDISGTDILQHSFTNEQPEKKNQTAKQCVKSHKGIKSCVEDDVDFIYVKDILELSGFITNSLKGTWYSSDHPLDPSLFEELEYRYPYEPECLEEEITALSHHLLLFDLVDEVLFDIFERSYTYYPKVLSSSCHIRPVPMGHHSLDEVWKNISRCLRVETERKQSLDLNCAISQDLGKDDGWMNLQFDSESLALELEDWILDELSGEIFSVVESSKSY